MRYYLKPAQILLPINRIHAGIYLQLILPVDSTSNYLPYQVFKDACDCLTL